MLNSWKFWCNYNWFDARSRYIISACPYTLSTLFKQCWPLTSSSIEISSPQKWFVFNGFAYIVTPFPVSWFFWKCVPCAFFNFQFGVNLKVLAIKNVRTNKKIAMIAFRLIYSSFCEQFTAISNGVWSCWNCNYRTLIEKSSKWKSRVILPPLECINTQWKSINL